MPTRHRTHVPMMPVQPGMTHSVKTVPPPAPPKPRVVKKTAKNYLVGPYFTLPEAIAFARKKNRNDTMIMAYGEVRPTGGDSDQNITGEKQLWSLSGYATASAYRSQRYVNGIVETAEEEMYTIDYYGVVVSRTSY
jgi:hypothetical protein